MSTFNNYCYKDTIYSSTIAELGQFGPNKEKTKFVLCPHKDCQNPSVELYTKYYLYRHIEERHPNDKKHKSVILK